ncbi:MAG TPA: GNAT family protein [Actinomycetota bacterium]
MLLEGRLVTLRRASVDDVDRLASILAEPDVARHWGAFDDAEMLELVDGEDEAFVVEVGGQTIGAIQFGEVSDPMYRHATVDIFLTTAAHRQGYGSDAIRTLARYLFVERGHHRLSIDPAADNLAAIAAYERVGFRPIGVMRDYERGPDGTWHDGLLMDMLVGELVESDVRRP